MTLAIASMALVLATWSTLHSYYLWKEVEWLWEANQDLLTYVRKEDE
jgi:hypothetical protein